MKCPLCEKGNLKKKTVPYLVYGIKLGDFKANVCDYCKEEWFDEETALKIEKLEKEKGLFGLTKKSKVGYSGNSLIIRIPKEIARFLKLKKEEPITIHPAGKHQLMIEF